MRKSNQVASVSNDLVLRSRFQLTATEQKLILYMASLVRPEDAEFSTQLIPFKEIERLFNQRDSKWGNIYSYLDNVLANLTSKTITFDTDVTINGLVLKGHISWVASAVPQYNKEGKLCIEFEFSKYMKPFFLELRKNFTKYQIQDIINMSSPNAIRLYQILKTHKDRQSQYRDVAVVNYSLDKLKERMGLDKKAAYNQYGNLKNRVLKTAQEQLEAHTHIRFEIEEIKKGRKVVELSFKVYNNIPTAIESPEEITLFSPSSDLEDTKSRVEDEIFNVVKIWGISRDSVKRICKDYERDYIIEKIKYTRRMAQLERIKASKASFLFGALKDDYKDEVKLEKQKQQKIQQKKNDKKAEIAQLKKAHHNRIIELQETVLKQFPDALDKAYEAAANKNIFGYRANLSMEENMENSPIFKASVMSELERIYPAVFKKERSTFAKELKVLEQ